MFEKVYGRKAANIEELKDFKVIVEAIDKENNT